MAFGSIYRSFFSKSLHPNSKRLLSSSSLPLLPLYQRNRSLSRLISPSAAAAFRFTLVRFIMDNRHDPPMSFSSGGGMRSVHNVGGGYGDQFMINHSKDSPTKLSSGLSERYPKEMYNPGCDFEHWLVVMDTPGGPDATKEQIIDCYVQTLAKVLGSEEEAKKKIYNVSCQGYFAFGCAINEETCNKLEGLPGVLFTLPDSYIDVENKDYGGELYENGAIVERPPERQTRLQTLQHRARNRPRNNKRGDSGTSKAEN